MMGIVERAHHLDIMYGILCFTPIRVIYSHVNFFYINWVLNKQVMHINSNEVPSQNQLTMSGITHKLIYMFKPLNFVNMGQSPLFMLQHPTFGILQGSFENRLLSSLRQF